MESGRRFRLVTRSDFDGLVCAVLLEELGLIDEILFVHPKDMQDGKVPITIYFSEWRSWRTLWRWKQSTTAGDGCSLVLVTDQSPDEVPIKIYYTGKKPDLLK